MKKEVKKVNLDPGNVTIITQDRESGETHDVINVNPSLPIESMRSYRLEMNTIVLPRVPMKNDDILNMHQHITVIQGKIRSLIYNFDKKTLVSEPMIAGQSIDIDGKFGIGFRAIVPNTIVLVQYERTPDDFVKTDINDLPIPKDEVESLLPHSKLV